MKGIQNSDKRDDVKDIPEEQAEPVHPAENETVIKEPDNPVRSLAYADQV